MNDSSTTQPFVQLPREEGKPASPAPATDEPLRMNVNENPRANENTRSSEFDKQKGGVGSEITDGAAS